MLVLKAISRCWVGALGLGLLVAHPGAQAQTSPKPGPTAALADVVYYLDGKQVDKATLDQQAPANLISYINVLKPVQAQQVVGQAASAVIVTTRAKANDPVVLAFNKRINEVVPLVPATNAQNEAMQLARTYLEQHYPTAKLESLSIVAGQDDRYRATFAQDGKRSSLLFDGQGHVVPQ